MLREIENFGSDVSICELCIYLNVYRDKLYKKMKFIFTLLLICISSSFSLNLERTDEQKYSVIITDGRDQSVVSN
jgi:hypothetical protein